MAVEITEKEFIKGIENDINFKNFKDQLSKNISKDAAK